MGPTDSIQCFSCVTSDPISFYSIRDTLVPNGISTRGFRCCIEAQTAEKGNTLLPLSETREHRRWGKARLREIIHVIVDGTGPVQVPLYSVGRKELCSGKWYNFFCSWLFQNTSGSTTVDSKVNKFIFWCSGQNTEKYRSSILLSLEGIWIFL